MNEGINETPPSPARFRPMIMQKPVPLPSSEFDLGDDDSSMMRDSSVPSESSNPSRQIN
jgi:hypothetical protein